MALADDTAARVRAARSYAGLTAPELAKALNVSKETLSRMENGRRPTSTDEMRVIADVTGVPLTFLTNGFSAPTGRADLEERVAAIERVLGIAAAIQRAERPLPAPPGELGRRLAARRTSDEDPETPESPPAAGQQ